jgi:uncharacterized protein YcnI
MRVASFLSTAALIVAMSAIADAHVGIGPKQSQANAAQTYTIRVPAEGTVPTTSLELEVPPGVEVISVHAPAGISYELKKEGARIVRIVWSMSLQPGAVAELSLMARNPGPGQVFWKSHQHFADGTVNHYDGPDKSRRPAITTTLVP